MLLEPNLCLSSGARSKVSSASLSEVSTKTESRALPLSPQSQLSHRNSSFQSQKAPPRSGSTSTLRSRRPEDGNDLPKGTCTDAVAVQGNRLSVSPRPALCPLGTGVSSVPPLVLRPSASPSHPMGTSGQCVYSQLCNSPIRGPRIAPAIRTPAWFRQQLQTAGWTSQASLWVQDQAM